LHACVPIGTYAASYVATVRGRHGFREGHGTDEGQGPSGAMAYIYVYDFGTCVPKGTLAGITTGNFADIVSVDAYRILDGDDALNGGAGSDTLFGGFAGSDTYDGGGGDPFLVAAGTNPLEIEGESGKTDIVTIPNNTQLGSSTLDLRRTALSSINQLVINDGLAVQLNQPAFT